MPLEPINPSRFTHAEFIEAYSSGRILLSVNTNAAGFLFQNVMKKYAGVQSLYRTIFFGGFFGGLISIYFVGWWSLAVFVLSILGLRFSRVHTVRPAIKAAIESEEVYQILTERQIIMANS